MAVQVPLETPLTIHNIPYITKKKLKSHIKIALFVSSQNGHARATRVLLENGANTEVCFNSKTTPLEQAASRNRKDCVQLLLQFGAHFEKSKSSSSSSSSSSASSSNGGANPIIGVSDSSSISSSKDNDNNDDHNSSSSHVCYLIIIVCLIFFIIFFLFFFYFYLYLLLLLLLLFYILFLCFIINILFLFIISLF